MSALLALHGFTGTPRSWDFLKGRCRVQPIVPALLGHDGSAASHGVEHFEAELDRLLGFIPETEAAHVVGYSLGARLALGLALRHPARVARLTLLSGHPGLSDATERAARRQSDAAWCELLQARDLTAFVDAWQAQPLWQSQAELDGARRLHKRAERLSHHPLGLVQSLRVTGLAEMPDYSARLGELRVPVSIVAGQLDPKFCALAQLLAARIPGAALEIINGAGHDLLLERPESVALLICRGNQT